MTWVARCDVDGCTIDNTIRIKDKRINWSRTNQLGILGFAPNSNNVKRSLFPHRD
jgi:hypothetical protein